MSVWREVQETILQRWAAGWLVTTPYCVENDPPYDPGAGPWARISIKRLPGGPGTIGRSGNKKMDRVGVVFIQLFEPPCAGTGRISDLAEQAAAIFENCRLEPHDIRFAEVEPGEAGPIEQGRWYGLSVRGRFGYEDVR